MMAYKTELEELTVDEAIERFINQWIFMRVTADDEHHAPHRGVVLSHHPKRGVLQRHIMKTIAERQGDEQYYVFYGERRFRTLREWSEATDAMIDGG